jgi:TonB family protein
MFNNLIESSSHGGEFKRRGSFLLFTTASYAVLFVIAGVVSIYAYDARMEDQNLEIVTMMPLVDLPAPERPPVPASPSRPINSTNPTSNRDHFTRQIAMADVDEPTKVPDGVATKANVGLPMPKQSIVAIGGPDSNPEPGDSRGGGSGTAHRNSAVVVPIDTPPPVPVQPPVPKVVTRKVINGNAVFLPKPPYPEMARQMGIHGSVNVQVLVDEAGTVVSAKAVSGHPFLAREAQRVALQARFKPTLLGDQPVKVSGLITYNFVLQK